MKIRAFVLPVLVVAALSAAAADYSTPMGRVEDSVSRVIGILKQSDLEREARWNRIAAVIREGFDFRSMSQSVLATEWRRATLEERERFVRFFSQYIEETYRSKIEAYTDQEIRYLEENIHGDRAVVKTEIITDAVNIPVDFKLKNNSGEWYAYDVVIEGVSLVTNYQQTFATIVKNDGMDGLLSDIQRRIDRHKREQAEQEKASETTETEEAGDVN